MTFDPKNLNIAVALIKRGESHVAPSWNDKWEAFAFPMTKIDAGPPAESAEEAAVRVAAEALRLPMRVVAGQTSRTMRTLQLSDSDGQIKDYHFTVVQVEVHPEFAAADIGHRSVIFASIDQLQAREYQPISPSVKPIIDELMA